MMLPFLQSQLAGASGEGVIDLCLDHKLIAALHPAKFAKIEGLGLFPDLSVFSATMHQLTSLSGLEDSPLLQELDLSMNEISDISDIGVLPDLVRLNLSHNEIATIEHITSLHQLEELDLGFNLFSDISPLGRLTSLRILVLNGNRTLRVLTDLPPSLEALHLSQCFVSNLAPVADLRQLKVLTASPGAMPDLAALTQLSGLKLLHINASRLEGALWLPELPSVERLLIRNAQRVTGIEGWGGLPNLHEFSISNSLLIQVPALSACPKLEVLSLKIAPIEHLDEIDQIVSLKKLILAETKASATTLEKLRRSRPDLEILV